MIKIRVERKQSKQLFWCQACGSKQSRTVTISSNDVQSSSLHLCDDCLKELADKIQQKLIRMYLEQFSNIEINDDDNKLIIIYSDAFEGNLTNEYLDCLAKVVNINVER